MRPLIFAIALSLALPAVLPAAAQTANPQLVSSVEIRMQQYGIHANVSQYPLYAVAQMHGILNSHDSYLRKRSRLRAVLNAAAPG